MASQPPTPTPARSGRSGVPPPPLMPLGGAVEVEGYGWQGGSGTRCRSQRKGRAGVAAVPMGAAACRRRGAWGTVRGVRFRWERMRGDKRPRDNQKPFARFLRAGAAGPPLIAWEAGF